MPGQLFFSRTIAIAKSTVGIQCMIKHQYEIENVAIEVV